MAPRRLVEGPRAVVEVWRTTALFGGYHCCCPGPSIGRLRVLIMKNRRIGSGWIVNRFRISHFLVNLQQQYLSLRFLSLVFLLCALLLLL